MQKNRPVVLQTLNKNKKINLKKSLRAAWPGTKRHHSSPTSLKQGQDSPITLSGSTWEQGEENKLSSLTDIRAQHIFMDIDWFIDQFDHYSHGVSYQTFPFRTEGIHQDDLVLTYILQLYIHDANLLLHHIPKALFCIEIRWWRPMSEHIFVIKKPLWELTFVTLWL